MAGTQLPVEGGRQPVAQCPVSSSRWLPLADKLVISAPSQPSLNGYGDRVDRQENMWLRQWHLEHRAEAFLATQMPLQSLSRKDEWRRGRRSLARACGIIVLTLPTWFSANAFLPKVAADYALDDSQAALLTVAVNIGFVVATTLAAAARLPDMFSAARLIGVGSLLCGIFNASMVLGIPYEVVLAARFMSGAAVCLIYPVAVRFLSTWFKATRGLALGCLIGSFTVGVAMPNLVRALLPQVSWRMGVAVPSGLALCGLAVTCGMREGPYTPKKTRVSVKDLCMVVRNSDWLLVTIAYLGHSFELFGGWAWMGAFLQSRMDGHGAAEGETMVQLTTFCVVAIGSVGCVLAGLLADRFGKIEIIALCNLLSGACLFMLPFVPRAAGPLPVKLITGIWGLSVNADSAQYSAMITEVVPEDKAGTAVTLSIACGFVLTAIGVYLVPEIVQGLGWEGVFPILGLGPTVGLVAILLLKCKRLVQRQ